MLDTEILDRALQKSGMNQSQLADKLGVNKATVSTTLHRDNIGLDVFVKYMNALGYSVYAGEKTGEMFIPEWELTPGNTDKRAVRNRKNEG